MIMKATVIPLKTSSDKSRADLPALFPELFVAAICVLLVG